jgi:hypothetical protein
VKRDRPLPKQSDGQAPLEKRYVLVWLCAFAGCACLFRLLLVACCCVIAADAACKQVCLQGCLTNFS